MPAQYEAPAWGKSPYEDLTVPSGGTVLAKRLDMKAVISAGLLEEFDALAPTVEEKVVGPAKGKRPQDRAPKKLTKKQQEQAELEATRKFLQNPKDVRALERLLALILPAIVQKPVIHAHMQKVGDSWEEIGPDDRFEGSIYTDTIPLGDQMFILQWAMEGMDMQELQQFRQQSEQSVDDVEDGEGA